MAEIAPFRGVLYNKKKVNLSKVVCPPYDVIPDMMKAYFRKTSAFNMINLLLPKPEGKLDKYNAASKKLNDWLSKDVLRRDERPAIYAYAQDYKYKSRPYTRIGFISLVKLEEPGGKKVLPHENTFAKPKEDRLRLLEATGTNLSCVFSVFSDKGKNVQDILKSYIKKKPAIDINFAGVRERLWRIEDEGAIKKLQAHMKNKVVFIADGHHRYESALNFKKISGYNFTMMYFAAIEQQGMRIMPTHRVIKLKISKGDLLKRLGGMFEIKPCAGIKALVDSMKNAKKSQHFFGVYLGKNKFYLLKLKDKIILDKIIKADVSSAYKKLDVTILHLLILEGILNVKSNEEGDIFYTRDESEAVDLVDKKGFTAAFLLNPTRIEEVRDIAMTLMRMPHKSTYFYPKLTSGLVINKHEYYRRD